MFSIGLYEVLILLWVHPIGHLLTSFIQGVSIWQTVFIGLVLAAVPIIYVFLIGRFFITKNSIGGTATHLILLSVWWFAVLLSIFLGFRFADGTVNFL